MNPQNQLADEIAKICRFFLNDCPLQELPDNVSETVEQYRLHIFSEGEAIYIIAKEQNDFLYEYYKNQKIINKFMEGWDKLSD